MQYMVAIVIPNPIDKKLVEIQNKYKYIDWKITLPPHLTLVPPFALNESIGLEKLIVRTQNVVSKTQPFTLTAGSIKSFDNKASTIYLSTCDSQDLNNLYQKLIDCSEEFIGTKSNYPSKFIPHITLSGDVPKNLGSEKLSKIVSENIDFQFLCKKVVLFGKSETDHNWIEIKNFALL